MQLLRISCVDYDYIGRLKSVCTYTLALHKETNVYIYCSNGDGQGLTVRDLVISSVINHHILSDEKTGM
ncbi:MAG TPA: hypothetical protein VK553_07745, partial [Candidatus Nitrosopolaris rasttigaisensis]|nr:hypothetical protein [Candidatus Nitrosopolaris rasttigaisensis]